MGDKTPAPPTKGKQMSVGREEMRELDVTVTSGTGTGNLSKIWAVARRIRVIPPNETAKFDASISDTAGDLIFLRTNQRGTISELQELSLGIAASVLIENANTDGTYKFKFDMH